MRMVCLFTDTTFGEWATLGGSSGMLLSHIVSFVRRGNEITNSWVAFDNPGSRLANDFHGLADVSLFPNRLNVDEIWDCKIMN